MKEQIGSGKIDNQKFILCTVCQTPHSKLYAVSKCKHQFCQSCSIAYISEQANHFSQAKCLHQGCNIPLDKSLPIYARLNSSTVKKLERFETFKFLQKNKDYASCRVNDCSGVFNFKKRKCESCNTLHCHLCLNIAHEGQCPENPQKTQLQRLGFKQCPACRTFVTKSEGCKYVACKCGMDFCYQCGSQFAKDPCRLKPHWEREIQIREQLTKTNRINKYCSQSLDSCPKIFFKIFALIMVLFFFSIFFIIITSVLFYGEVIILSICCIPMLPYVVYDYFVYSESHEKCKKNTYKVILVVLYPLWTAIGAVSYVLAMLLYPCLRNPTSHGLYDFFYDIYDLTLSFFAKLYMKYVHRLIDCML